MYKGLFSLIVILLFNSCSTPEPIKKSIMIQMRDGIKLATDLYFPQTGESTYPIILIRTCYNKDILSEYGVYYSKRGFITAIQDVRGKYASEGKFIPFFSEGKDGYDAVEWLGIQKWSSGKVGMVGGSYSGIAQIAAAIEQPPHLTTIIPNITPAVHNLNTPFENGAFALGWAIRWAGLVYKDLTKEEMAVKYKNVFQNDWYSELLSLPVKDLDKKISGNNIDFWQDWNQYESNHDFYTDINYLANLDKIKIPVFLQSGWFDIANRGTKLIYDGLVKNGNPNVKLIIGPWVHSDKSSSRLGSLFLGKQASIDLFAVYSEWFNHWLLNESPKKIITNEVKIFNIGPNEWVKSNQYPIRQANTKTLYLFGNNSLPGPSKEGILKMEVPSTYNGELTYEYDPGNPTPSLQSMMKKNMVPEYQRIIEERKDNLYFQSEKFDSSFSICGDIRAEIYISSSAPDTDFCLNLVAIDKNGKFFPIGQTFSIVRAKFRNSNSKEELLEKNKVYKINFDLSHTFYTISKDERLALIITSSSFPDFSRNLNTGKNSQATTQYVIAKQKIHFSNLYKSKIILNYIN